MKTTSIEAYKSILPTLGAMKARALQGLIQIEKGTSRQIAEALGIDHAKVWKRMGELETDGHICPVGIDKDPESGRSVTVWGLTK